MPAFSVIICTHNPRPHYLRRVLDALAAQTLAREKWELLLIDNASEPAVAADACAFHPRGRVIREEQLGLTPARLRGIREATAEVLLFVDDDNVLAPDYLERAVAIGEEWPQLGAWGGQCIPEFEEPPAEWTRQYWNWIGIRELDRDYWSNVPNDDRSAPFGAGMCVRRRVAERYAHALHGDALRLSLDRTGTRLLAAGDSDLVYTSSDLGLGNGIFAALKLTHLMPRRRLEEDYLLQLVEAMTYSHTLLRHARGEKPSPPSRSQRLLRWYEHRRIPAREKRFEDAREAGYAAALRDIERLKNNLPLRGLDDSKQ